METLSLIGNAFAGMMNPMSILLLILLMRNEDLKINQLSGQFKIGRASCRERV